jgi:Flp pilus assembly pilin Flp
MRKKRTSRGTELRRGESGSTLLEYSLLVGMVSATGIFVFGDIVPWLTDRWTTLQTALRIGSGS